MGKLSISDFKRSNVLLLVIVAVAVSMFIFIPEFIGLAGKGAELSKSISFELPKPRDFIGEQDSDSSTEQLKVAEGTEQRLKEQLVQREPLSQLEYLIDQGYIDYLVEARIQEREGKISESQVLAEKTAVDGQSFEAFVPKGLEFIPRNEITWAHIHSKDSLKTLADVNKQSTELLARIHTSQDRSRVALLSFISAVNQVVSDSKAFSSPKEAIELLDRLDRAVTTAMLEDRVSRGISADWARISLSKVLGLSRAERLKQALVPAYNPDPALVHVVLSRDQSGPNYTAGKDARLAVKFVISGEDFKEAHLERETIVEKVFVQQGKVRKFAGQEFPELIATWAVPDIYTLVIENTNGEIFKKVYDFRAPRYNSKTWVFDRRSGQYYLKLPYGRPNSPQLFEQRFAYLDPLTNQSNENQLVTNQNSDLVSSF